MDDLFTPMLQIRANALVTYNRYNGKRKTSIKQKSYTKFLQSKKYSGLMTESARSNITRAINLLVSSAENRKIFNPVINKLMDFKLSFITLTIPDIVNLTTKDAHKLLLEPMLKHLRQVHGMKNYVWKLEVQKRGVIHYHLTSDCFIIHSELRNKWNKLIERCGFMEQYKANYKGNNPNSTDIHSVKQVNDLASYLVKYFAKQEQNSADLPGKIWDCSTGLKKARYYSTELTDDIRADLSGFVERFKIRVHVGDRFCFLRFNKVSPITLLPKEIQRGYYKNLLDIRNFNRCSNLDTSVLNLGQQIVVNSGLATTIPKPKPKIIHKQFDLFYN